MLLLKFKKRGQIKNQNRKSMELGNSKRNFVTFYNERTKLQITNCNCDQKFPALLSYLLHPLKLFLYKNMSGKSFNILSSHDSSKIPLFNFFKSLRPFKKLFNLRITKLRQSNSLTCNFSSHSSRSLRVAFFDPDFPLSSYRNCVFFANIEYIENNFLSLSLSFV